MSDKRLAVVSGAAGGIGSAIASQLRRDGYHVAMLGRDRDRLEAVRDAIGGIDTLHTVPLDPTNASSVREPLELIGIPITAFVHAAGSGPVGRLIETTDAMWADTIDGKLMLAVRLVRELLPALRSSSDSSIVFVNGAFAYEPDPNFIINGAVNCALAGFAKALARDQVEAGLRVNTVHPGATRTQLWDETAADLASRLGMTGGHAVTEAISANLLGGRITLPTDVAEAVSFLLSSRARHITGSSIVVDGGAIRALV